MIAIVSALLCEAQGLISHFELKPFPQNTAFPLYYGNDIFLIISGIGKTNAAAAISYLYVLLGERPHLAWLNIGIAGHPFFSVGEGRLVHSVKDQGSGVVFYSHFPWKLRTLTEAVLTVEKPESAYEEPFLYEMEASGFCQSAFRFSSSELIHCYKVVSDNREAAFAKDPKKTAELFYPHLAVLTDLINTLFALLSELKVKNKADILPFLEKWRFTVSEIHVLRRNLQRWNALNRQTSIWDGHLSACRGAKQVLTYLEQKIEQCFS